MWLIGTDCGDTPTRTHDSFETSIAECLADYQAEVVIPPRPAEPNFTAAFTPQERAAYEARHVAAPAAERAFMAGIIADRDDDVRRLVFADWLEENGQPDRAAYIRARVTFDGRPESGTFADAVRVLREGDYLPGRVDLPAGFRSFHPDPATRVLDGWWGHDFDDMERGLPSCAEAAPETTDPAEAARILTGRLPALLATTPLRGLRLRSDRCQREWAAGLDRLFDHPAAAGLTRLAFDSPRGYDFDRYVCPAAVALAGSPLARRLVRLEPAQCLLDDASADVLAAAPFDRLRRFESSRAWWSPAAGGRFMASPWLARLHSLTFPLPPGMFGPVDMPDLHTLILKEDIPGQVGAALPAAARNATLPGLRRLIVQAGDLRGEPAEALAALRAGEVVELWLRGAQIRAAELKRILHAPWAGRLEVLTVGANEKAAAALDKAIDASPCAATLRIRRVG